MSSPLAKREKSFFDRSLNSIHRATSHHRRLAALADVLTPIVTLSGGKHVRCLDVGCGDMGLLQQLAERLPHSTWIGADIHSLPSELLSVEPWSRYVQFDGVSLPFERNEFDMAVVCDVLHHVNDGQKCQLLRDVTRVAKLVVVKDHFEYGQVSRQLLRAMDFVGNYGYGVSVPKTYFRRDSFEEVTERAGATIESLTIGIDLYRHLPFARWLLRPEWHFVALVHSRNS